MREKKAPPVIMTTSWLTGGISLCFISSPLANPSLEQSDDDGASRQEPLPAKPKSRRRAFTSAAARPFIWSSTDKQAQSDNKSQTSSSQTQSAQDTEMNQRLVDFLDAVDPEIGTVSTLNNIQNSLFVPNLGSWVNRGALVRLTTPEARAANRYSQLIDEQEKLREKGRTTENNRSPAEVAALGASEEYAKALEERRPSSAEPTTHPDDASAEEAEAEKARKRAQAPLHFDDQRIPAKARLRGMSTSSMRSALSAPKLRHQPTVRGEYAVLPVSYPRTVTCRITTLTLSPSQISTGEIGLKRKRLNWMTMCTHQRLVLNSRISLMLYT